MRFVLAAWALGLTAAHADNQPRTLDNTSVLIAVIRALDDFDYGAQAEAILSQDAAWQAMGPGDREVAVAKRAQALAREVDSIDEDTVWRIEDFVRLTGYDPETGRGTVAPALREIHPTGVFSPRDFGQLRPDYFLIIANHDVQRTFTVSAEERERARTALRGSRRAYLRIDLNLGELLQGRHLLAAIVAIDFFSEPGDPRPIASWRADRAPGDLTAASPLREGLTLDVIPNHHLELDGGRLLDPLETRVPGRSCAERGRFDGHLVVHCEIEVRLQGIQSRVDQTFVGGRLVRSAFTALEPPEERNLTRFDRYLVSELDRSGTSDTWESASGWTAAYDGNRWGEPDRLADAPFLVITATAPGFRFDAARVSPLGPVAKRP